MMILWPSCSLIIPTKDHLHYLEACLESVLATPYDGEVEVIIIDNDSRDPKTLSYLESVRREFEVKVISWNEPFNFSKINNAAAAVASGEVLCFLNNDIEVISADWLSRLAPLAKHVHVGAVGPTLLYPDHTIQHAGIALDPDWVGKHIGCRADFADVQRRFVVDRPYKVDAVTAACMLTRKSLFLQHGGFDEQDLTVSFNDLDYCLRLQQQGYSVLVYPGVQLLHHESITRGSDDLPQNQRRALREKTVMASRWKALLHEAGTRRSWLDVGGDSREVATLPGAHPRQLGRAQHCTEHASPRAIRPLMPSVFPPYEKPRASIVILGWKQRDYLLACLRSLHRVLDATIPYEVIVLLNGASSAVEHALGTEVKGVRILSSQVNLGFGAGCNMAAAAACGEYLVLLNDDAEVEPDWLTWLVRTADAQADIGAVGSCVLSPEGIVLEAGSVIWRDGSTAPVGRGNDDGALEWFFVRDVDYASACSLLVRRTAWDAIGGFDERYFPAYYEDVDLCLSLRSQGWRVRYEPRSRIRHHESASSDLVFKLHLFRRNRRQLTAKWQGALDFYEPPAPHSAPAIRRATWRARGCPTRVLVVDDLPPDPGVGSGYGRMHRAVLELSAAGLAVSVLPTLERTLPLDALVSVGIEVIAESLEDHLARPEVIYEFVVISRPHNFERAAPFVRRHQPWARIVYDCEALFWRRLELQATIASERHVEEFQTAAERIRAIEERAVQESDHAVCVSADEAAVLSRVPGHCPIDVLPPLDAAASFTERPFEARRDAAFIAGWRAGPQSPNADGLRWFADEVLPLVCARLPWVRILVTGTRPPPDLRRLGGVNLRFEGQIDDLRGLYDRVRATIAPLRFGAGVKVKVLESLQHGVPVVATPVGAEGIETSAALRVARDPADFATQLVTLLTDPDEWARCRADLRPRVARLETATRSWVDVLSSVRRRATPS